jgi:hypothetical protein
VEGEASVSKRASLPETVVELTKLVQKLGAKSLEIGFFVDGDDPDRDPRPDEEITWWAKAHHRGGPVWSTELRARAGDPTGHVRVLADLATKMGGKVRIRWEEAS